MAYIWEYYKIYIISGLAVIGIIIAFINTYQRNNYTTECSLIVVDGKMTGFDTSSDAITTGFQKYLGLDGKKHRIVCDYNFSIIPRDMDLESYYSEEKIYTLASTSSLDGIIANDDYITYFCDPREVFFTDLREILSVEELSKIQDYIIYYSPDEESDPIPVAVNLTGTKIKTSTDLTMENPCYGVVCTAPNAQNAVSFIRYAFDL